MDGEPPEVGGEDDNEDDGEVMVVMKNEADCGWPTSGRGTLPTTSTTISGPPTTSSASTTPDGGGGGDY